MSAFDLLLALAPFERFHGEIGSGNAAHTRTRFDLLEGISLCPTNVLQRHLHGYGTLSQVHILPRQA
jgi:hypothetical protein